MRINYQQVNGQLQELLTYYTELKIDKTKETNLISLSGFITVARQYNGYTINNNYNLKILIPLCDDELPSVIDIGMHIDKSYPHRYEDGELCLETDAYMGYCFSSGYTMLKWMKNIVEPYYYTYEYHKRFGEYPFGERAHNIEGVLQTYQQIFEETDIKKVYKLLRAISTQKYKGHLRCPCESGLITRNCHGRILLKFYCDNQLCSIAHSDYANIERWLEENDKQRNNHK